MVSVNYSLTCTLLLPDSHRDNSFSLFSTLKIEKFLYPEKLLLLCYSFQIFSSKISLNTHFIYLRTYVIPRWYRGSVRTRVDVTGTLILSCVKITLHDTRRDLAPSCQNTPGQCSGKEQVDHLTFSDDFPSKSRLRTKVNPSHPERQKTYVDVTYFHERHQISTERFLSRRVISTTDSRQSG